jgi:glycosyltransferase involved in cell wall biosynthesis
MLLSIVSGTYNRAQSLHNMMESARLQIPRHISYEFIIVDGGSEDNTIEYLRRRPDTQVVEQGELRGAIPAFCDGAKRTRGEYVILANDDVTFVQGSILRAIAHLESNRTCGAVAFADDRAARMSGNGNHKRVLSMPALLPNGKNGGVNYAQVGMFRRWLGEYAGWWGADDDIMRHARTYGGDNYLSARIWEAGYTVDAVTGCEVNDSIREDQLREKNRHQAHQDSVQYYHRYPYGPAVRAYPELPNPQWERLRVLLLDIHEPRLPAATAKEYGLADALDQVGLLYHIDYVNEPYNLVEAVRAWQPHLLVMQCHDTNHINAEILERARRECRDMVVINWNGDAHERGLTSPDILQMLQHVDIQTGVNAAIKPVYDKHGINWQYWQIGYKDPAAPYGGNVPAHDVVFLGNCYIPERHDLIGVIRDVPNIDFGLYGSCPGAVGNTHYDFAHSQALYQHCKIAIGDTFPGTVGFVSNRLFQALSAGAFLLQQYSPELDAYTELIEGEHYIAWRDLSELRELIPMWLDGRRNKRRIRIAENGRQFVRENFSYDAQVRKLWQLLETL